MRGNYRLRDLALLRRLLRICAAPLAFDSTEAWLQVVAPAAQELVGGEGVTVAAFDAGGQPLLHAHTQDPDVMREYAEEWLPQDPGPGILLASGMQTYTRERLWALRPDLLPAFLKSPIWHDYYRRYGLSESVGLIVSLPGRRFGYIDVSHKYMGHPHFGEWGHDLFRVAEASFRAGMSLALQADEASGHLASVVDALPMAAWVYSPRGRLLHANHAGAALVHERQGARTLTEATVALAVRAGRFGAPDARGPVGRSAFELPGWRLSASHLRAGTFAADSAILVLAERVKRTGVHDIDATAGALSQMTPRQREVARCVAEGLTNREIAGRLACSTRTVRAHVSDLLQRTGSRNRAALARMIRQAEPLPDA